LYTTPTLIADSSRPVVIVLIYFFGRLGFAFSIGILSHLIGDFLVGTILLYPLFPNSDVGLNLGIPVC